MNYREDGVTPYMVFVRFHSLTFSLTASLTLPAAHSGRTA